jgi:hypothetical protein
MKIAKLSLFVLMLSLLTSFAEAVEVNPNLENNRICISSNFALVGIHADAGYAKQLSYDEGLKSVGMSDLQQVARSRDINPLSSDSIVRMKEASRKIRRWLLTGEGANTFDWDNEHTASHLMAVINERNAARILKLIDDNTTLQPMQVGIAISYGASIDVIEALLIRTNNYTHPWFDQLAGHEHTLLTVAIDSNNGDVFSYLRDRFGGMTNYEVDILRLQVFEELNSEKANEKKQFLMSRGLIDILDTSENKTNNTHFIDVAEDLVREREVLIDTWKHVVVAENTRCKDNRKYLNYETLLELQSNSVTEIENIESFLKNNGHDTHHASYLSKVYYELVNLIKVENFNVPEKITTELNSFFDLINTEEWEAVRTKYEDIDSNERQLKSSVLATIALMEVPAGEFDRLFIKKIEEDTDFLFTLYELGALDLISRVTKSSKLSIIYDSNFKSSLYHFLNGGGEEKRVEYFNLKQPHKDNKGITYLNLIAGKV